MATPGRGTTADAKRRGLTGGPAMDMPVAAPGQIMHGNQPGVATAVAEPEPTPVVGVEPPAAAGGGWGSYLTEGVDGDKKARGHSSPKYQVLQTASRYDPKAGITPEMLAELNALGLGTFTGGKDKLYVGGEVDPRFEGYTTIDLVRGFNGPGGGQAWQYGAMKPGGQTAAAQAPALNQAALRALMTDAPGSTPVAGTPGERVDVTAGTPLAGNKGTLDQQALALLMDQRGGVR